MIDEIGKSGAEAMKEIRDTAFKEAHAVAFEEGYAQSVLAERTRLAAILFGPEAQGREAASQHLAFETNLSANEAVGLLATISRAEPGFAALARTKDALGGLLLADHADPAGDFERGREIAKRVH